MGWWISRAPELEEDVALANIGLDQLGQARTLLAYAGGVEGAGRGEDDLAYLRDDREFRNVWLVERPQTDFGVTMARLLLFFAPGSPSCTPRCAAAADATLAGVAGKAVKEVAYHLDHAAAVGACGSATAPTSPTRRMQAALDAEWPYVDELFTPGRRGAGRAGDRRRPGRAARRRTRPGRAPCSREATLTVPQVAPADRRRPPRPAHRAPGLPAGRDAAPRPVAPGGDMVSATTVTPSAWQIAADRSSTPSCRW